MLIWYWYAKMYDSSDNHLIICATLIFTNALFGALTIQVPPSPLVQSTMQTRAKAKGLKRRLSKVRVYCTQSDCVAILHCAGQKACQYYAEKCFTQNFVFKEQHHSWGVVHQPRIWIIYSINRELFRVPERVTTRNSRLSQCTKQQCSPQ